MNSWFTVPAAVASVLRPYQAQHLELGRQALERGARRLLMQAPTGAGKTTLIAALTAAATAASLRVLILAPRTRLVRQLHERLLHFRIAHGVIAAELPRMRLHAAPAQVCAVDTLYRRALVAEHMPLPGADIVIFDEAHLALGRSRIALLERYPAALHIGFTATPAKVSGRPLSNRYDELILGPSTAELIAAGYLIRPRVFSAPALTGAELEQLGIDRKSGDYPSGETSRAMSRPKLIGDVLMNWLRIAGGRRTLIFACDKAHGASLLEQFLRAGVAAELLTDQTAEDEREAAIARLERGETLVLVNCTLLSYGVDVPSVECIVLARPTRSVVLYLQVIGRGLRPAPGKDCCIVIDHGRVVETLGMPHEDFAWSLDAGSNVNADARAAPGTRSSTTEKARTCAECSHIWLVSEDGPACTLCGWMPAPAPKPVGAIDIELREIGEAEQQQADADQFFCQALGWYRSRWPQRWGEKPKSARWWAWQQTRTILKLTAEKPPGRYWELMPVEPSPAVAGKLRSRMIAFARARARAVA